MEEARQAFAIESSELLEGMESSLLILEGSPHDKEAINSVFRAAHTLKGSAGLVGLDDVQGFTHVLETLLEKVRKGDIRVTSSLIGLLLECRDHLSNLIHESMNESLTEYTRVENVALLERLNGFLGIKPSRGSRARPSAVSEGDGEGTKASTDNWHISLRFGPDVMRHGMDPISFLNYLTRLGEIVSLTTLHDDMPPAGEMDPESCYLGFEIDFKSDFDKQAIADVFEFVQDDCRIHILPPRSQVDSYIDLIESLPEDTSRLGEILVKGGALTQSELNSALNTQEQEGEAAARSIGEILVDEGIVHPSVVDAAVNKQKTTEARGYETKTVRVETEKLDQIINLVGEMVISGANIDQQAKRMKDRDLLQSASMMSRLIEDLRDKAMSIRMMPLQDTFARFARVVRDICHDTGKDIELVIRGGETELDKTVIEKIKDPLMHLVRNAADHGLEMPEERLASGKPAKGTLVLNAFQDTGDVVIEVEDDGRGLDLERIYRKALEQGLSSPGAVLSEEEKLELMFLPGLSTAREVTNISGRGVGMDVVKSNIESLNGSVKIESSMGEGTTVRIRLPLTLAIIDGFLVEVGSSFYVVPMDMVTEGLELTDADRRAAHGRHFVKLREQILPYIRLRELFDTNSAAAPQHEHILVVQHSGREVGLLVDTLHGEIQAVIKPLGRFYKDVRGISAATILGNGTVALILDVPELVEITLQQEKEATGSSDDSSPFI